MRRKIQPLIDLINDQSREYQLIFAQNLGISHGYLQQVAYGFSLASPKLAKRIERATLFKVTAVDIRPDIFGDLQSAEVA